MIIVVHGGAGARGASPKALKKLRESLKEGYRALERGAGAAQAVITAITVLEDSGLFNAGAGGNLQLDGVRRLDASIMSSSPEDPLRAGAVMGLEGFRNPIKAASLISGSAHRILTNIGAAPLCRAAGLAPLPKPGKAALKALKEALEGGSDAAAMYREYFSTVGAVAIDEAGCLAAGSSTGGVAAMAPGRIGDTPIIGAGVYADNFSAVSCTGRGEDILRLALAKEICMGKEAGCGLAASCRVSLKRILSINSRAGVIALDNKGRVCLMHTTDFMPAGYIKGGRTIVKDSFIRVKPLRRAGIAGK